MPCPHVQFRAQSNRIVAREHLSTYLASAPGCPECDLLLRVVEEFKPGWIDANKNGRGSISLVHKSGRRYDVPATVNLLVGLPYPGNNGLENAELMGSFQFFRRSRGMVFGFNLEFRKMWHSIPMLQYSKFTVWALLTRGVYTAEPMYEDVPKPISKAVLHQTLGVVSDSFSKPAFERAAKWLSYCLDHDKECKALTSNFMPRRLLNVGSWQGTCDPFLFDPVETAPYACLSYCWGTDVDDVLRTTKGNLESHYHAIPFSLLPRTIRHAVILCRGLGIPNLWVDSLCIVQDDKDSWLHDSAQMSEIYLNSHVTIAAEEPASCKLGFLGNQRFGSSEWQRRCIADVPVEAGGPGKEIFIRAKDVHSEEQNERFSLDKRGWCLQESILPNRRLCFNGNEMIWECSCRKICECGHVLWAPRSARYGTLGASIKSGSSRPYEDWRALVEEYSDRSLTQKTDKLSAVSGLAKMINNILRDAEGASDIYLAGLWKREFLSDLTWCVVSFGPESQSAQHYRAPSWSWASVDGSVRYEFWKRVSTWKYTPRQEADCAIDEVICRNSLSSDPTSPVIAAHAVLTGLLAPVELTVLDEALSEVWQFDVQWDAVTPLASKQRSLVRPENLWSLEVFLDHPRETSLRVGDEQSDCWMQGRCGKQCCRWGSQTSAGCLEREEALFYCFRLFTWRATGNFDDSGKPRIIPPEVWYLVLQKSSTTECAFERVGIGVWSSRFDRRLWGRDDCPLFDGCESVTIKIV